MGRKYGLSMLLAVSCALAVLLAALAIVQYRWSTRVAAADAQREREHLDSAASLFASQFDAIVGQAVDYLQNDAWAAFRSGEHAAPLPRLFTELYHLDLPERGTPQARRLDSTGLFTASPAPAWIDLPRCIGHAIEQPPALIVPLYNIATAERRGAAGERIVKTAARVPEGCFAARLDQAYLHDVLIPQLILRAFGETAAREYDFAVIERGGKRDLLYGAAQQSDLRKPFFSISPGHLALGHLPAVPDPGPGHTAVLVQSVETVVTKGSPGLANLYGPGIWELSIAHRGSPLAAAFEKTRQRDWLASLGVETLLLAAIVFLVIGARRIQRLADQKMQFIAGVSHELRTPVSAIAMLARNQADGLVSGADKVKQYGELIHQQSRRLNEMVEETLEYAGIHSGLRRPARNPVDLDRLIHAVLEARCQELERHGFEVEVALTPDLPPVHGDESLLRTAFDNLLSNAGKYAQGGRWIRVSADYSAPDQEVRISVIDRGAGIDAADQAEIFEPFCRGRAAIEAQIPGSGLGLSLVRSVAEAHRGSVTLDSAPGRGSTFTLHLPV